MGALPFDLELISNSPGHAEPGSDDLASGLSRLDRRLRLPRAVAERGRSTWLPECPDFYHRKWTMVPLKEALHPFLMCTLQVVQSIFEVTDQRPCVERGSGRLLFVNSTCY